MVQKVENLTGSRNARRWITLGAVVAGLAVVLGAFGAHQLDPVLAQYDPEVAVKRLANWKTAASYQMYQAIGLMVCGLVTRWHENRWISIAGWCLLAGAIIFSGCLYLLTLTDVRALGAIVPIGGTSMIAGWLLLAVGVNRPAA